MCHAWIILTPCAKPSAEDILRGGRGRHGHLSKGGYVVDYEGDQILGKVLALEGNKIKLSRKPS